MSTSVTGPLATYPGINASAPARQSPSPVLVPSPSRKSPSPSPAPKPLTCNYCDSCVNGVTVPAKVDPGCPAKMIACASGACPPPSSSDFLGLEWYWWVVIVILILLLLGGGVYFMSKTGTAPSAPPVNSTLQ